MERLRNLIQSRYKVDDSAKASDLLKSANKPFLPRTGQSSLGDEVLVQILACLEFGAEVPDASCAVPPGGYPAERVAEAVALIMLGLEEWVHGEVDSYDPGASNSRSFLTGAQNVLREPLDQVKENDRERWVDLSARVFRSRSEGAKVGLAGPVWKEEYMQVD